MFYSSRTLHRRTSLVRGFTLLEIMVVLAIIGLIVGLAVNSVQNSLENARRDVAHTFVNTSIKTSLVAYSLHLGGYPSTSEGLAALCTPPQGASGRWRGPYAEQIPLDPWAEPYQYAYPGKHNTTSYDLWSKGPDRQDGTEDDIGNWTTAGSATGK